MRAPLHLTIAAFGLAIFTVSTGTVHGQFNYETNNGTITITGGCPSGPGAVTIPSTINGLPVTSIGYEAFYWCTSLTSIVIPDSVTSIEDGFYHLRLGFVGAFSQCDSLTNVVIGNSVTSIGDSAFAYCTSLTSVTIGNSVTSIGGEAFYGCTSLTSVTIPNSVTSIGNYAFEHCTSLTSVVIPNSVTNIGYEAFYFCTSLTNVVIGNSVTSIGDGAFLGCSSLTSVTIPNSVTSIGGGAFYGCTSLTSVTIPNSVTGIGGEAFYGCTSLTSVTIPNSVTGIGRRAFEGCTSLSTITVDSQNQAYSSLGGVLFNKNQTTLVQYPGGKAVAYNIPNSVTTIGDFAFSDCTSLTSVTIPNSVTSIGVGAFYSCTSLTSVTIPNSVTSIGWEAFSSRSSLTRVYFRGNAPSLPSGDAFYNTTNAIVYYLPGTLSWGSTFGSRPTELWAVPYPVILTTAPNFGIQTNAFGFRISWATNTSVVVEASTTLANPTWSPVSTNTLMSGWTYFSDAEWTNHPGRFYRVRSP